MYAIITSIINDLFLIIWICCLTLEPRFSRKKTVAITAGVIVSARLLLLFAENGDVHLMELLNRFYFSFFTIYYVIAIIIVVSLYLLLSAWKPMKSVFVIIAYICLWILMYIVVSVTLNAFPHSGSIQIWTMKIGLNLIFLFLYEVYIKKRLLKEDSHLAGGYYLATMISVLCLLMLSVLLVYSQVQRQYNLFLLSTIAFACVFVIVIYTMLFSYIEKLNNEKKLGQIMLHEELLTNQIEFYERMEQNVRRTRHDIRHHNMVVEEFAKKGDCKGILSYLQEYEEEEGEKYTRTFCNNSALDSVLAVYARRAEENGIEFQADIKLVDKLYITDYDIVSILANILENAIHGCKLTGEDCSISISMKQKGYKLIIICKNTCVDDINFVDGLPKAEKREGVGVMSILQSAEKYNGNVSFSAVDHIFTCNILLNNIRTNEGEQNNA